MLPRISKSVLLSVGASQRYSRHLLCAFYELTLVFPNILVSEGRKTAAWGDKSHSDFINYIAFMKADMSAESLLFFLKEIEKRCKRQPRTRWQEREVDLDILFYEDASIDLPHLHIPHPGWSRPYLLPIYLDIQKKCQDANIVFPRTWPDFHHIPE